MQFEQIISLISVVLTAISAVGGADVSKFSGILAKISSVVAGLSEAVPSTSLTADIQDLTVLLTTLKSSGVLSNTAPIDEALTALGKFTATLNDLKSGQFAIIDDNISFEGLPCVLLMVSKGSAAYQLVTNGTTDPSQL